MQTATDNAIQLRAATAFWLAGARAILGEHRDHASQTLHDLMRAVERFHVSHDERWSDDPGDHLFRVRALRDEVSDTLLRSDLDADGERLIARGLQAILTL